FAHRIKRRCSSIGAEANRPVLMGDARQWNALADEQTASEHPLVTRMSMLRAVRLLLHEVFELLDQPFVAFLVVWRIAQLYVSFAIEGDAVLWIGQVFRREPEVERVFRHQVERESGRERWRSRRQGHGVELAHERDVAHGKFEIVRAEVEVVDRERLLENRRVGAL